MNTIETDRLSHRYGRTEAVHDLSLTVPAGSVCALLGPNGAGKTTTIKTLMNLLQPTRGTATVLGVDSRRLGPRELAQIGYVSENQPLPGWMTVAQLLDFCRPLYPTWDVGLEKKLLAQFDLPPDHKLKQLSRGQLMKASLLSSLAYRPRLLVLDEPFSGLDPVALDDFVRGLLEAAGEDGWTVLMSSHDIEEVERLSTWIVVLDGGSLRLSESTDSLLGRFRRIEVTLPTGVTPAEAPLPPDWLSVERHGGLVRFIASRHESDVTVRAFRERFPGAAVLAHPMTLREIYLTLARPGRNQTEVSAP